MSPKNDIPSRSSYVIAELLEFYDSEDINRFEQACIEFNCNITEAFNYLREVAVQYVAIEGYFANFTQLAEMYACTQGFVGSGFMSYFQVRGQEGPQ